MRNIDAKLATGQLGSLRIHEVPGQSKKKLLEQKVGIGSKNFPGSY